MKITLIGAGSLSFGIGMIKDVYLSEQLKTVDVEMCLMDIEEKNLNDVYNFANKLFADYTGNCTITKTTELIPAVAKADFVVVAIEKDRYHYWKQDFHVPKLYGSTQAYGENGGPGSMFHTLRNAEPMLEIARAMEVECPSAILINYTNPEGKLVEILSKLTKIKVVGLCHGLPMGLWQIADLTGVPFEDIGYEGGGLNHFGWYTKLWQKSTGIDLYPILRENDEKLSLLHNYDHMALSRLMYRLYGLYPYPGTNHIGEYVRYGAEFYSAHVAQFLYDPVTEDALKNSDSSAEFVYAIGDGVFNKKNNENQEHDPYNIDKIEKSGELAIEIIHGMYFDEKRQLFAVNMPNNGAIAGIPDDMVIETQAEVDKDGVRFIHKGLKLPTAVIGMTNIQGTIHQLLVEAFTELSRDKLLQAILIDPQAPSYYQAVKMIDEMFELQKELLPKLEWENKK